MGYKFSKRSRDRLGTCCDELRALFGQVIMHRDCTILEGHRDMATQNRYFAEGKSKVRYPRGRHNSYPSQAVDVAPFVSGKASFDTRDCYHFAGYVLAIADHMGIGDRIRWGGDWDRDHDLKDQSFNDLVHFEMQPQ